MKCSDGREMVSERLVIVDPNGEAEVEESWTCDECIMVEAPWCRCGKCWITPAELEIELKKIAAELKAQGGP